MYVDSTVSVSHPNHRLGSTDRCILDRGIGHRDEEAVAVGLALPPAQVEAQEKAGRMMLEAGFVGGSGDACQGRYVGFKGRIDGPMSPVRHGSGRTAAPISRTSHGEAREGARRHGRSPSGARPSGRTRSARRRRRADGPGRRGTGRRGRSAAGRLLVSYGRRARSGRIRTRHPTLTPIPPSASAGSVFWSNAVGRQGGYLGCCRNGIIHMGEET